MAILSQCMKQFAHILKKITDQKKKNEQTY